MKIPTKIREKRKQFEVSLCFDHQSWSTGVGELNGVFSQEILLTKGTNCKSYLRFNAREKTVTCRKPEHSIILSFLRASGVHAKRKETRHP